MPNMPEPGRQAAHVLLDTVSVFQDEDQDQSAVMNLALERLNEVGAVEATFNDETDTASVDVSNLVGGTLVMLEWLVGHLGATAGWTKPDTIVRLREFLDANEAA